MNENKKVIDVKAAIDYLRNHKKSNGLIIGAVVLASLGVALMLPAKYKSVALLMPPQQQSSSIAQMLSGIGGVPGIAAGLGGIRNPNDLFVGILTSNSVLDYVASNDPLTKQLGLTKEQARGRVLSNVTVTSEKNGLISIAVEDVSPDQAAKLANYFYEGLVEVNKRLALTDASRTRVFFSDKLEEARGRLNKAELSMRNIQDKTGILSVDAQMAKGFEISAGLKAKLLEREVQLKSLLLYATSENSDVKRLNAEITAIRSELAGIEDKVSYSSTVSTMKLSEASLEYLRGVRDLKYAEAMVDVFTKQYELARIEEAKQPTIIQLLDKAQPAEEPFKPKRILIVILGLLTGIGIVFARALYKSRNEL